MAKLEVFQMDTYWDGANWVENSRMSVGAIKIDGGLTPEAQNRAILEALLTEKFTDITGRSTPLFKPNTTINDLLIRDFGGDWLEVVEAADDDERPIYGIQLPA